MFPVLLSIAASEGLVNSHVQRTYHIQDNLITVSVTADFMNDGPTVVNSVDYILTARELSHVGLITASVQRQHARDFNLTLPIKRDGTRLAISLPQPLDVASNVTVYITFTLGGHFLFLRPTISLNQQIFLLFNTSLFYQGPYPTLTSTLIIEGINYNWIIRKTENRNSQYLESYGQEPRIEVNSLTQPTTDDFELEFRTARSLPAISRISSRTFISHWGKSK
jgi:hypothetical protein